MKKILEKNKKQSKKIELFAKKHFVLKFIFKSQYTFTLIRWNSFQKLSNTISSVVFIKKCVISKNKKRFNKLTYFSRHIFLKLLRNGKISGFIKKSW